MCEKCNESVVPCFNVDAKPVCSPIPIALENLKEEVTCLPITVLTLTNRKQKECSQRETDHQLILGTKIDNLPNPVADTAGQREEKDVDKLTKLLNHLGESISPIGNGI